MAKRDDTHPQFKWNGESNSNSISDLNVAPAPSFKVKPGNRLLQFGENFSVISDSASEAGSLLLPKKDCENYALKKANSKKSSKLLHFEEDKNTENVSLPVWDYLQKQDEKLKMLENQVSSFLLQEKTSSPVVEKNENKTAIHHLKSKSSEAQLCELNDLESHDHCQSLAEPLSNLIAEETACKNVVERGKQDSIERQLCEHNSSKVNDHYLNLILLYLKEQNDQIRKLQDQLDLVVKRTGELESFNSIMKERHFSGPEQTLYPIKSKWKHVYTGAENAVLDGGKEKVNDEEIISQEPNPRVKTSSISTKPSFIEDLKVNDKKQTQVKKVSSSTMTSLIIEDKDKLVVSKTLTVVTDISNHQRDLQSSWNENSSPSACNAKEMEDKYSSELVILTTTKKNKNTTSKLVDSKKCKQKHSRKHKELSNRSKEDNQEFSSYSSENNDFIHSQSSPFHQIKWRGKKTSSPKFDSDQENKLDKKEKIMSHEFSHSRKSREKDSLQNFSYPDCSSIHLNERCASSSFTLSRRNRKFSVRLSSSSGSSDDESPDRNPQYKKWDERHNAIKKVYDSSSISQYGINTGYLSDETKQYLEKNNLVKLRKSSRQKR